MSLAEAMIQASYGRTADPDAKENQSIDFQDGFAVGYDDPRSGSPAITEEYHRRGFTDQVDESFREWKRGYWAGVWTRYDNQQKTQEPKQ